MEPDDTETLNQIVKLAVPIAMADLSEQELVEAMGNIENAVGISTLTAIDLAAQSAGELLDSEESCARALLVTLRVFQTCLVAFREINLYPTDRVVH